MTSDSLPPSLISAIKILTFLVAVMGIIFLLIKAVSQAFSGTKEENRESKAIRKGPEVIDAEWVVKK